MTYAAPVPGGDGVRTKDLLGHILVVEPVEHAIKVPTKFGEKDAIRATIHDISTSETHENVLLFGGYLVGDFKRLLGQKALVMLYEGTDASKGNPPILIQWLQDNPQACAAADAYMASIAGKQFAAPDTAATPAPPAPLMPGAAAPAPAAAAPSALDAALGNLAAAGLTK